MQAIEELLICHEGIRLKPYTDTQGKLTIGVGRNLTDKGISKLEAMQLLRNDIETIRGQLNTLPVFRGLKDHQKAALIDMGFNLGFSGILQFTQMWNALGRRDHALAAKEMLDSKWARQTGNRAVELARMIKAE